LPLRNIDSESFHEGLRMDPDGWSAGWARIARLALKAKAKANAEP
jgi:hypothetical protein